METTTQTTVSTEAPIALRRPKRRCSVLYSPKKSLPASDAQHVAVAATPGRRSKRVRFSDSALPSTTSELGTGITPHLRRASLGTPRRRAPDTPSTTRVASTPSNVTGGFANDIQFTPFRQVLDDRAKRRIRRNGMSEEMNGYEADKKAKVKLQSEIDAKDAELKRLRAELDEARNNRTTQANQLFRPPANQQRVDEVEAELEALRQSFALEDAVPVHSWNHIPIGNVGPNSDGGDTIRIYEDEDTDQPAHKTIDADSLAMGLELEAARQAKKSFLGSFRETGSFAEMNFADSPARRQHKAIGTSPRTPKTFYHDLSKQLKATASRAEDAELALKSLETEIAALGFGQSVPGTSGMITAISEHFRQARLDLERALPGETVIGFENAKVLPEIMTKLQTLANRVRGQEFELKMARDQQHSLKNNFEKAIVAAEKATARIKNLESSIDSTAEEMLNLRIRAQNLEKDLAEKEKDVTSLTTALNKYRADVARLENLITNLEKSHTSSLAARDQTISDLDAKAAAETKGRRAAETSAVARLAKISELESALSTARSHAESVEEAMTKVQSHVASTKDSRAEEVGSLNSRIANLSSALTVANTEVEKLKIKNTKLEERVELEVQQGARTFEAIQMDFLRSVAKMDGHKKSFVRGTKVRSANWDLLSDDLESDGVEPITPNSLVRFAEFSEEISGGESRKNGEGNSEGDGSERGRQVYQLPETVEIGRGLTPKVRSQSAERRSGLRVNTDIRVVPILKRKPKRRYDSGIGMSSDIDLDLDVDSDSRDESGYGSALTPEFSSEVGDVDIDLDLDQYLAGRVGRRDIEMSA